MGQDTRPNTPEKPVMLLEFETLARGIVHLMGTSYFKSKFSSAFSGQLVEREQSEGDYILVSLEEIRTNLVNGRLTEPRIIRLFDGTRTSDDSPEVISDRIAVENSYRALSRLVGFSNTASIARDSAILAERGLVIPDGQLLPFDATENAGALIDENNHVIGVQIRVGPNLLVDFKLDDFKINQQVTTVDLRITPTPYPLSE